MHALLDRSTLSINGVTGVGDPAAATTGSSETLARGLHRADSRAKQMNVRPLHDRIVVRRVEEQEVLPGGIVIPDTAKEKPQKALVLAVGTGRRVNGGEVVPLDVRVGDEVLLGKYSGTEVVLDGEELLVLRESDVLAVLEPASEQKKAA